MTNSVVRLVLYKGQSTLPHHINRRYICVRGIFQINSECTIKKLLPMIFLSYTRQKVTKKFPKFSNTISNETLSNLKHIRKF